MAKTRARNTNKKGTASLASYLRTSADSNATTAPRKSRSTRMPWPSGPENLSGTGERMFSQEIVAPVLAVGGLEARPMLVKVLARFSDNDYREFETSYGRVLQWAKRHDKSAAVNFVAPDIDKVEAELR